MKRAGAAVRDLEFYSERNIGNGVMSMPALVICEKIASVGRVLRPAEIQDLIEKCC
jgi:hypothetical protein